MSDPNRRGPGTERQGDVAVIEKPRTAPRWAVVFHNDDYTTKDFVVYVLIKFFQLSETAATHVMLSVHHKGAGVAGVYTRDIAETKAAQVTAYAKQRQMPLKVTAEPASSEEE